MAGKALGVAFDTVQDFTVTGTLTAANAAVSVINAPTITAGALYATTGVVADIQSATGIIGILTTTTGSIANLASNAINSLYYTTGVLNALTATGTNQATAALASGMFVNVTVAAPGTGVNLLNAVEGLEQVIENNGASAITVYAAQGSSDTINGNAASVGVKLFPGAVGVFRATASGVWICSSTQPQGGVFRADAATSGTTLSAAGISGGSASVDLLLSGTLGAGANVQLPTVADLVAALPNAKVGASYRLRIINASSANFAWTVTTNTGWTLVGTMTIAQNTWREFVVTIPSILASATLQSVATGTYS